MNIRFAIVGLIGLAYQSHALAATGSAVVSSTGSILKMVLGLAVVLAVMALISWVAKRMLPNGTSQNSAVKVIGGVSVGSRERVVVLEVAGRWLVVGVAQGQVSAIANLEVNSDALAELVAQGQANTSDVSEDMVRASLAEKTIVKPFSQWLKKSAENIKTKRNQNKV